MVNKILRAGNNHEKEYVVTVNKPLTDAVIQGMANGVPMLGVTTKKCKVVQEGVNTFRIILVQGLNRQIRRMCEHFGYEVTKLERVRIMNISLKGLPLGDWRDLTASEMDTIYNMIADSASEDVKKTKPKSSTQKKSAPPPDHRVNKDERSRKPKSGGGKSSGKPFGKSKGGNNRSYANAPKKSSGNRRGRS
jgi:23S rRNA pseudouridine2604 synthase